MKPMKNGKYRIYCVGYRDYTGRGFLEKFTEISEAKEYHKSAGGYFGWKIFETESEALEYLYPQGRSY